MKIDTFVLAWNEERLINDFISWYDGTNITVLDNISTDNTVQIARSRGCKVIQYGNNTQNNDIMRLVKETCWKNSTADWVIVCDMDEFIYHPKFFKVLSDTKASIIKCTGYQMVSENAIPPSDAYMGAHDPLLDKCLCFRPDKIINMNWDYGCHNCNPSGEVSYLINTVKMFHYNLLGRAEFKDRRRQYRERMSDWDKTHGVAIHYLHNEIELDEEFDGYSARLINCKC